MQKLAKENNMDELWDIFNYFEGYDVYEIDLSKEEWKEYYKEIRKQNNIFRYSI